MAVTDDIDYPVTKKDTTLDERIVKVSVEVNGKIKTYKDLYISAVGVKYANPLQNEAEITIYNLDKATQDFILTETSLHNANYTPKTIILEAGRKSYGTSVIYRGNVTYSSITQPPDTGVVLKCATGNFLKTLSTSRSSPGFTSVKKIAEAVAAETNLFLDFQATNKVISNYGYSGSSLQELSLLASLGQLTVFVDDGKLVVKNANEILAGNIRKLSASTGLIGIPEFIERGVRVKMLVDNKTVLGGGIELRSSVYPAVNGVYLIYQLAFIITNRLTPFYYIADCQRVGDISDEATNG